MLTVSIPAVAGTADMSDHTSLGWSYTSHATGRHVGQNAFGVKRMITERVTLQQTLEVDNRDLAWLKTYCSDSSGDITCELLMPAAKARAMDGDIRVAFGATLTPPYMEEQTGTNTPSIDSPFETYVDSQSIYIVPNQVVIYAGRTGEVVADYSKQGAQKVDPPYVDSMKQEALPAEGAMVNGLSPTAKAVPRGPVHVSEAIMEGHLVSGTLPVYPDIARRARLSGTVVLAVQVSTKGEVENVEALSGFPFLRAPAIAAVKQWHYSPYVMGGNAVEVNTTVTVTFSLNDATAGK